MANILSSGASAATSSDVVLADGESANLVLIGAPVPADAVAIVYADNSGSTDTEIDRMTNAKQQCRVYGPGTFRVYRIPGPTFGVDSL